MKNFVFFLFAILVTLSCNSRQSCNCISGNNVHVSLGSIQIPAIGTYTINQTQFSGVLNIGGDLHNNINNTCQWQSNLIIKVNNVVKYNQPYVPQSSPSINLPLLDPSLHPGTNTISIEGQCNCPTTNICPIATYTIILNQFQGNVTTAPKCCNHAVQLIMTGSITGGNGYLKIEKEVGSNNWVQQGALLPFVNNGATPCYPRHTQMTTQRYRSTLVDIVGQPILNNASATTFPLIFGICYECCIPKD